MMREPVRSKFMSAIDDLAHDSGITFGNPSERKKCPMHASLGEYLEYAIDIAFDAAFPIGPSLRIDHVRESFDLKIILNVDGQRIGALRRNGRNRPRPPAGEVGGCVCR